MVSYGIGEGTDGKRELRAIINDGNSTGLQESEQFVDFLGSRIPPVFCSSTMGCTFEVQIDRDHNVGAVHPAGVKDVIVESAVTTIQDCEDSVAAVDAEDKVAVYSNWLGLMKGDLTEELEKDGRKIVRKLSPDREYLDVMGNPVDS